MIEYGAEDGMEFYAETVDQSKEYIEPVIRVVETEHAITIWNYPSRTGWTYNKVDLVMWEIRNKEGARQ